MKWSALFLVALLVVGLFAQEVEFDEEIGELDPGVAGDFESETSQEIQASPFAEVHIILPDSHDGRLAIGEVHEALISFKNNGPSPYNVSHISGSLNNPQDLNQYVQNMTATGYGVIASSNVSYTISYRFRPELSLEGQTLALLVQVDYFDQNRQNFSSKLNYTVTLYAPEVGFDFGGVAVYTVILGGIGLGAFTLVRRSMKPKKGSKASSAAATSPNASPTADRKDLSGTNLVYLNKGRKTQK